VQLVYQGRPIRVSGDAGRRRLDIDKLVQMVMDPAMGHTTIAGYVEDGKNLPFWTDSP